MSLSFNTLFANFRESLSGWYWSAVAALGVGYLLPMVVLTSGLLVVFSDLVLSSQMVSVESFDEFLALGSAQMNLLLAALVVGLVIGLCYLVASAGLYRSVVRKDRSQLSWQQILRVGAANALRLLGFCLFILLFFIPFLLVGLLGLSGSLSALGLAMFLFFVFFVILAIFGVFFSVSIIVFFRERGVINAFRKSFALVQGNWFRTFGALLLLSVASFAISFVFLPVSLILGFLRMFSPVVGGILEAAFNALLVLFTMPLGVAYLNALHDALAGESSKQV